jgi:ATP-dependent DNA ligase
VYAGLITDGGLSLQEIISAFRKKNDNTHKLEYHVYDIPGGGTFEERAQKLGKLHEKLMRLEYEGTKLPIKVVWTGIVNDEDEAATVYNYLVSEGYEGMMYRNAKGLYEFGKRSYDLQKRKPRQTTEAKVIGCTVDKNNDGVLKCELETGVTFECLTRKDAHPTINYRKYENAKTLIGKFVEIEFEELSNSGVVLKPVSIGIREVDPVTWQPLY